MKWCPVSHYLVAVVNTLYSLRDLFTGLDPTPAAARLTFYRLIQERVQVCFYSHLHLKHQAGLLLTDRMGPDGTGRHLLLFLLFLILHILLLLSSSPPSTNPLDLEETQVMRHFKYHYSSYCSSFTQTWRQRVHRWSIYGWNSWHRLLFAGLEHFYSLDCYTFLLSGLD